LEKKKTPYNEKNRKAFPNSEEKKRTGKEKKRETFPVREC